MCLHWSVPADQRRARTNQIEDQHPRSDIMVLLPAPAWDEASLLQYRLQGAQALRRHLLALVNLDASCCCDSYFINIYMRYLSQIFFRTIFFYVNHLIARRITHWLKPNNFIVEVLWIISIGYVQPSI